LSSAIRLGLADSPGLTDYLVNRAGPQDVLQTVELAPAPSGNGADPSAPSSAEAGVAQTLVCITAGTQSPQPSELLQAERFHDFLKKVSKAYEMVILDTSPLLPVADTLELVPLVDCVLMCVRSAQTTRDQAHAAKAALEHLPERPTGLVVTGIRRRDAGDYGYYSYSYGGVGARSRRLVG
jgi:Mrp family chromosome partitioning ATPase